MQTLTLSAERCHPVRPGEPPLPGGEATSLLLQLPGWALEGGELHREYVMRDFSAGVRLIESIAEVSEREDHHPDLHLTGYRRLLVSLSTHSIGGLSLNDFILAAKIDALPKDLRISS